MRAEIIRPYTEQWRINIHGVSRDNEINSFGDIKPRALSRQLTQPYAKRRGGGGGGPFRIYTHFGNEPKFDLSTTNK